MAALRSSVLWWWRRMLLLLLLFFKGRRGSVSAEETAAKAPSEIYGRKGSSVLFLGAKESLRGKGVLEWKLENRWILTYYFGSNEPEVHHPYESRVELQRQNGSLLLHNLTEEDGGVYTLQVKFKDVRSVKLKVLEAVHVVSITRISSTSNCTVQLECKAVGDVWNLTWERDNKLPIGSSMQLGNVSFLTVEEPGTESLSAYTCHAQNPISEDKLDYKLQGSENFVVSLSFCCGIAGMVLIMSFVLCECLRCYCPSNPGARRSHPTGEKLLESVLYSLRIGEILSLILAILGQVFILVDGISILAVILLILLVLAMGLYVLPRERLENPCPVLKNSGVKKVWNAAGPVVVIVSCVALLLVVQWSKDPCRKSSHLPMMTGLSIAVPVALLIIMVPFFYFCRDEERERGRSCADDASFQKTGGENNVHLLQGRGQAGS
ncbi:carcinoembryonic antigen-related cell adhesion molecule 6-like isoform X1 [Rhinatrema bivittatum]|uniref:carcinoembryonic antigen-related cell adhesion molecule 6-like isoform X1 n=1 Tax=Rhinatrema bivittatum TaxID=194408 RepID=UPI00112C48B7|nr:carcinoembryonic antigen-related cell adhesion molecule 6-like isoform X1 [Rhinatrema bivittatum]